MKKKPIPVAPREPQPPPTEVEKMEAFKFHVVGTIAHNRKKIEEFRAALESDPSYAFEWGDAAQAAAGYLRPYLSIEHSLSLPINETDTEEKAKEVHDRFRDHITEDVIRMARWPKNSTSHCGSLAHVYELSAWAEMANLLRRGTTL